MQHSVQKCQFFTLIFILKYPYQIIINNLCLAKLNSPTFQIPHLLWSYITMINDHITVKLKVTFSLRLWFMMESFLQQDLICLMVPTRRTFNTVSMLHNICNLFLYRILSSVIGICWDLTYFPTALAFSSSLHKPVILNALARRIQWNLHNSQLESLIIVHTSIHCLCRQHFIQLFITWNYRLFCEFIDKLSTQ